jgi:hypothetical protein
VQELEGGEISSRTDSAGPHFSRTLSTDG